VPEAQERAVYEALSPAYRSVLTSLETASGIAAAPAAATKPSIELMRDTNDDVLVSHCTRSSAAAGEPFAERSRVTFRISPDGVVHGEGTYLIHSPEEMQAEAALQKAHLDFLEKFPSPESIKAYLTEQDFPTDLQDKIGERAMNGLCGSIQGRIASEQPVTEDRAKEIRADVVGRFLRAYKEAEDMPLVSQEEREVLKAAVLDHAPRPGAVTELVRLANQVPNQDLLFGALASSNADLIALAADEFALYLQNTAEPAMRAVGGAEWGPDDRGDTSKGILSLLSMRETPQAAWVMMNGMTLRPRALRDVLSFYNIARELAGNLGRGADVLNRAEFGIYTVSAAPQILAERADIASRVGRGLQVVPTTDDDLTTDPASLPPVLQDRLRGFLGLEPGAPLPRY
jgi:hypothetical protein